MNTPTSNSKSRRESIQELGAYHALELWNQREAHWPTGRLPKHPIDAIEPSVALAALGFEVVTVEELGRTVQDGREWETAGVLDRTGEKVLISARNDLAVQRFTLAHELGHVLLHPKVTGVHRDRAVTGPSVRRDLIEKEADWFAAGFLMPEREVERFFSENFGTESVSLRHSELFALATDARARRSSRLRPVRRDLSHQLALATSYGGRRIRQLTRLFGVNSSAMAIRLEELDFVTD